MSNVITIDESAIKVDKLLEMAIDKLSDESKKMEETAKDSSKIETSSLKNEPTQKKTFFRFFSLRLRKSSEKITSIQLEKPSTSNNEIQVVEIDECATTDIDKVKKSLFFL